MPSVCRKIAVIGPPIDSGRSDEADTTLSRLVSTNSRHPCYRNILPSDQVRAQTSKVVSLRPSDFRRSSTDDGDVS